MSDESESARKRALAFSGGIGAGIAGGAARLVLEPVRHSLEHVAPGRASRHVGLLALPAAALGAAAGVKERKLQMELAGDPRKRREYMRSTGAAPATTSPVIKTSGMETPYDTDKTISGRPSIGQSSEGVELGNVENVQALLDAAFSQRARMNGQVKKQLGDAFPQAAKKGYGRAKAVGIPAREASDMVLRALSSPPKEPVNR